MWKFHAKTKENTMEETVTTVTEKPSLLLTIPAKLVSYVFHPLFIPTYVFVFLVYQVPYEFAGITNYQLNLRMFSIFWLTAFFPAFAVFLLWRLKFSESIFLRTQKERIVPYIITMFFYWWMYYLSRNFTDQPEVLKFFYMGIFVSTVFGLVLNNYFKISLHAMGVGGALAAIILFAMHYKMPLGVSMSIAALIAGIVCTARFLVSDHTNKEVYVGLFVGVFSQLAAYYFVM
ncbi:MAG: hypothetical protein V4450_11415 [Bacteroidota bacterium]